MLTFKHYITEQKLLNEKLLLINNGKKYGQIVFLAGGAGSGKGFAGTNFMNSGDYKIRDVDEMKKSFLKMNKLTHKYPELDGLNLKNPDDVGKLHNWVDNHKFTSTDKNLIDTTMMNLINGMRNPTTLPNIIFDVTLKNVKKIKEFVPALIAQGYNVDNIHLVWVLTDYKVAVEANRTRDRVVPDDILLQTHDGAHKTMWDIVGKGNVPKEINGGIYVILNNRENTVFFSDKDGKDYRGGADKGGSKRQTTGKQKYSMDKKEKGKSHAIIKDFTYLTYKEPKKSANNDAKIKKQLHTWVINNVPLIKGGAFSEKM